MKEADIIEILKTQCIEYAKEFGCLEITHISGSPFYTCELNGVLTALYPVAIKGNMCYESESKKLESFISIYKDTHKIIRLEVTIDDNNHVIDRRWVIVSDLGGSSC
jgi:hypothetical protein